MKKIVLLLLTAISLFSLYWFVFRHPESKIKAPKLEALQVKKHSDTFNIAVNNLVNDYLHLKDAFVLPDTAKIRQEANALLKSLAALQSNEWKNDSSLVAATVNQSVQDLEQNVLSILRQTNVEEMRRDFSSLNNMMYPTFFKAINYEGPKLYLFNCPMAFNDTEPANWISNSEEVVNPYLGKNHPKYHAGMLHCGEIKDSITGN